jgi:hypothetical protein
MQYRSDKARHRQEGQVLDLVCNRGLFDWYRCKWESPEISYAYHFKLAVRLAGGVIGISSPLVRVDGGKLNVCNLGAIKPEVKVVGGLSPQIDSALNVIGVDDLVNALLDLSFEALETLVMNTILDAVDWLVGGVSTVYGNVKCFA